MQPKTNGWFKHTIYIRVILTFFDSLFAFLYFRCRKTDTTNITRAIKITMASPKPMYKKMLDWSTFAAGVTSVCKSVVLVGKLDVVNNKVLVSTVNVPAKPIAFLQMLSENTQHQNTSSPVLLQLFITKRNTRHYRRFLPEYFLAPFLHNSLS